MAKWPIPSKERKEPVIEAKAPEPTKVSSPEPTPAPLVVAESASTVPAMTEQDRESALAEYVKIQEMKLQAALDKRKKAFAEKLHSQRETQAQVAARQLRIKQLRGEIQERRIAVKKLKQEIRELRPRHAKGTGGNGDNAVA